MKTIILQGDGIADLPSAELGDRTPLQVASTPSLDYLASHGEFGSLRLPGTGLPLTGDVTHLALLGYDPQKYYSGPGPLAGIGLEVVLDQQDVAFICNIVTLATEPGQVEGNKLDAHVLLEDDTAGGISTEEARELIEAANEQLGGESIQFYTGTGSRHLMVWVGGVARMTCHDPHFAVGQSVSAFLPQGEKAAVLKELMEASRVVLRNHPVNQERVEAGLKPGNGLWLWGPGKPMELHSFKEKFGVGGVTLSNSDLHIGISRCAGMKGLNVDGDGDSSQSLFKNYAESAVKLLAQVPVVYLHVQEQPDIRDGYRKEKVSRLEQFDQELVGPLVKYAQESGDCRILVVCNRWGGSRNEQEGTPSTPFALLESGRSHEKKADTPFNEVEAQHSPVGTKDATRFMNGFLGKSPK
jgi:2,3-bisphosphoglycerate-independent phosphoglycerate mutase